MIKFREIRLIDQIQIMYLLSQLTTVNYISNDKFRKFLDVKKDNHKIYVILDNDEIVGCGTILIEPKLIHGMKNVGHIEDIVIDKKKRGKKYGYHLINFLVNIGKTNNCYKIILDCSKKNIGFYEKCKFKEKESHMVLYF